MRKNEIKKRCLELGAQIEKRKMDLKIIKEARKVIRAEFDRAEENIERVINILKELHEIVQKEVLPSENPTSQNISKTLENIEKNRIQFPSNEELDARIIKRHTLLKQRLQDLGLKYIPENER